ncbi:MAG TPA: CoA transferase [Anaerolineales bacterium]|nr:CoA transferase [Anaerolineales bacterium]HRQ92979.1 CoA transferase [Anaerolineales bacterium]
MTAPTTGLLSGIRVLDLTRVLAGPYCTMLLGDMGADVIKVEAPDKGDDTRHWGPPFTQSGMSAYFISANRNKRSLTLNLKHPAALDILRQLIAKSDVLVENFKPGTLERLGLSYEALQELRPDLIYCTVSGYGYSGPDSHKPGYDFIAQARGGLMSITGPADGEPVRVGLAIADLLSGIYACNAITAALFARERQKTGQRIDISLFDAQVGTLSYVASNYLISGQPPKRYGNGHPNIVPYQSFKASDGYFAFASGNDGQWSKFCAAAGRSDLSEDPRFASNPKRVENREVLIPILDELFATRPVAEWLAACEQAGVPAGPINTIDQVFSDPQVLAREMVLHGELSSGEAIDMLASPIKVPTSPMQLRYPPPALGEHTQAILNSELGLNDAALAELKSSGAI